MCFAKDPVWEVTVQDIERIDYHVALYRMFHGLVAQFLQRSVF